MVKKLSKSDHFWPIYGHLKLTRCTDDVIRQNLAMPHYQPHKSGTSDNSEPLCRNGLSFGVYMPNRLVFGTYIPNQLWGLNQRYVAEFLESCSESFLYKYSEQLRTLNLDIPKGLLEEWQFVNCIKYLLPCTDIWYSCVWGVEGEHSQFCHPSGVCYELW